MSRSAELDSEVRTQVAESARRLRDPDPKHRPSASEVLAESCFSRGLVQHVALPPYWVTKDLDDVVRRQYPSEYKRELLQDLLRSTAHTDASRTAGCAMKRLSEASLVEVQRNENVRLFKSYERKRAEMREYHRGAGTTVEPVTPPLPSGMELLDPATNEVFGLMHGTTPELAQVILENGFDERLAQLTSLYGAGIYITDASCKAMQYCTKPLMLQTPPEPGKEYVIIFCRALLGAVHSVEEVLKPPGASTDYVRRPPDRGNGQRWDSVMATAGAKAVPGGGTHSQVHREFVLFSRDQIYPEYLVRFKVA